MLIKFKCPSCGKAYSAPDDKAGSTGRCRECGARLTVPVPDSTAPEGDAQKGTPVAASAAPASPQPPTPVAPKARAVEAAPADSPSGRRRSAHRRGLRLWVKAVLALLGVGIIVGGRAYVLSQEAAPEAIILLAEHSPRYGAVGHFSVYYVWLNTPTAAAKNRCFIISGTGVQARNLTLYAQSFPEKAVRDFDTWCDGYGTILGSGVCMSRLREVEWDVESLQRMGVELECDLYTEEGAASGVYMTSAHFESDIFHIYTGSGLVALQIMDFRKRPPTPVSNKYWVWATYPTLD
jgi:DNA-directed RNA polymerase subunit RPC12/RpoP